MSVRGRLWRVDDWFRPVRPDGTMPSRRHEVTPKDRLWIVAYLVFAALVVTTLFLRVDAARALAMSGGLIGVAVVQALNLYRTRDVGFGTGR